MKSIVQSLERRDRMQAYVLLTPGLLVLLVLALYPLLFSLYLSFSSWDIRNPNAKIEFNGIANYIKILASKDFGTSLFTTLKFIFFALILEIFLGLMIALVITDETISKKMAGLFRATLILTIVMIPVVSGILWKTILQKHYGPLNYFLGFLGVPEIPWLSKPSTAFISIIFVEVWQQTTVSALIFIGGLMGIDKNYLEAGKIDGCSGFRLLWHIILPMLKPIFAIILLLRSIALLKVFDFIYSMTYGGPGSATEVVNLHIFRLGLQYLDFNLAAAASWVLLVILLPLTLFLTLKVFLPRNE